LCLNNATSQLPMPGYSCITLQLSYRSFMFGTLIVSHHNSPSWVLLCDITMSYTSFTIWHYNVVGVSRPWYSWIYCNAFCGISWATLWCSYLDWCEDILFAFSARSTGRPEPGWTRLRSHLSPRRTYPGAKVRIPRETRGRTQFFSFYLASTLSQLLELMTSFIVHT